MRSARPHHRLIEAASSVSRSLARIRTLSSFRSDVFAAYCFAIICVYTHFQWTMAVVLALNRYTALYKPVKHEMVTRSWKCSKGRLVQLWRTGRQNIYILLCFLVAFFPAIGNTLTEPFFYEIVYANNVTVINFAVRKPLLLVRWRVYYSLKNLILLS